MDTEKLLYSFSDNPGMYRWNSMGVWAGSVGFPSFGNSYRPKCELTLQRLIDRAADAQANTWEHVRDEMHQTLRVMYARTMPSQTSRTLAKHLYQVATCLVKTKPKKQALRHANGYYDDVRKPDVLRLVFKRNRIGFEQWVLDGSDLVETGLADTIPASSYDALFTALVDRQTVYEFWRKSAKLLDDRWPVVFRLDYKADHLVMTQPGWKVRLKLQEDIYRV